VGLHQQVTGFVELVVEGQVVDLEQDSFDLHARVPTGLDLLYETGHDVGRIIAHVNTGQLVVGLGWGLTLGCQSRFDPSVNRVVLVVQVGQFDDSNSREVAILVELGEKVSDFVDYVKQRVFILDALNVLDVCMVQLLERLPQMFIQMLNEIRQ
jgi:hypothetical protein